MSSSARSTATLEDFWAIPEHERFHELIGGELTEKAAPSGEHGDAQAGVIFLARQFQRRGNGDSIGGWWIQTEVEVRLDNDIVRPDIVGWRRERSPQRPTGIPIELAPDWICEVISPSRATHDTVKKLRLYHQHRVAQYWLVDPRDATLTVMRWSADGYVTLLCSERHERVRAEPFEAVELAVGTLFGDDPID